MVCWSVIAMFKEYVFLTIALSALATLTALKLEEKCCKPKTRKPKDIESHELETIQPESETLGRQSRERLREFSTEEEQQGMIDPSAEESKTRTKVEISPERQPMKDNFTTSDIEVNPGMEIAEKEETSSKSRDTDTVANPEKESRKPLLEEVQQIREERNSYENGAAEINMNNVGEDEDLQPNVTMRSTMSGLCSCIA